MAFVPSTQPITARGTATINGTITGTMKKIDPRLSITLENGYISAPSFNPPLSNITVRADVENGALDLQKMSIDAGPATLTASGQVPFALLPADLPVELPRRQGPAQFTAQLNELDLGIVEGLPQHFAGAVSAQLEARAERPELESLEAKLTFPQLRIGMGSYELQQQGNSAISIQNGTASIDQLHLTGPETDIKVAGTAGLTGARALDIKLNGTADAAIASIFTDKIRARGGTELQASITGTAQQPSATGYLQLTDAQVSLAEPRVGLDQLNARVDLAGQRANLTRLTGNLNGGPLSGGGGLSYVNGELRDTDLTFKAERVYLDFPAGLKTVSDIGIRFRSTRDNLILGGEVVIQDGGFSDNLNLDTGILAALTAPRGVELTEERNDLVESILFDLGIRTSNPLIIDNNLAEAEIEADLKLLGNPYQPGLSGRLSIIEGGRIRLNERVYLVERGEITFANERKIEPALDILATTRVEDFDFTLQVTGVPGKTETTLTSDPPLPEPDIMAMLLTGKRLDDLRGQEYEVARNQVLSYLTGRVGGSVGSRIAGATGLSTVRIEPNLIANETDPGARLTVGQDITRNLELIYSMDLIDSSNQIYVAEYDLTRRFSTRGVRQADGTFRFDFRHDVRFGGLPEPRRGERRQRLIVDNVSILGNQYFTDEKLADKLGMKTGKRYDFFKSRKGLDKIGKMYEEKNLLEANVRLQREVEGEKVDLALQVTPGPVVDFVWEGISPDGDLEKRVREIWRSGVFDRQRGDDAAQEIKTALVKENYLQPEIKHSITTPAEDRKRVLFDVTPGRQFSDVEIVFEGAQGIKSEALVDIVKGQKLKTEVYVKPGRVTELVSRYYAEQGYLDAAVENPRYELDGQTGTGRVVFPVNEGQLYRIASVEFNGNSVYDDAKLASTAPLPKGQAYRPILRERSLQAVQELYWEQGYNDVDVEISTQRNKQAGTIDVVVNIAENRKSVVAEIVIEGNQKTSNNLIGTQLVVKAGEALNLQKLNESRRNLYNTGAYSVVEIAREEIGEPSQPLRTAAEAARSRTAAANQEDKRVRLTVKVREVQPFQVRYGASFDTERGPGVIADFENHNSLGSARSLGLRTRYDSQLQEARLYFSQPLLRRFPLKTIVSPFYRRERNPSTEESDAFNVDRMGISFQQESRWRDFYIFNYGYRIENSKTVIISEIPVPATPLRIAALTSTFTRETRDDVLDATRGDLISNALEFSPKFIGSQVRFIKYFGQFFKYIPLEKPKVEIFTNKMERPRFVYAGAIRVGLAKGFSGQDVPLAERFLAGGSNTIRGFEQNSVGPTLFDRTPLGGEAMLVINNEVRHRLFSIFDIAGFMDIGNVYERASDISLGDLRKSAGLGLRVRTPWILLRLDYGFKLDRRPEESLGRLFFSIGQAF
jgi:outer membrane protein assembly factor BamA